jgi:hypothetical protein
MLGLVTRRPAAWRSGAEQLQPVVLGEVREVAAAEVGRGSPISMQQAAIQLSFSGRARPRRRAAVVIAPQTLASARPARDDRRLREPEDEGHQRQSR